jgi:para-nitrobenzyl esterase
VFLGDVTVDGFKPVVRERFGPRIEPLLAAYRDAEPGRTEQHAWVDLVGDLAFRIPVIRIAEAQAGHGTAVFAYRFDWRSPMFGGRLGAAHAHEEPVDWTPHALPTTPILLGNDVAALQPFATAIHTSWANFIRTGDPNGGGLPSWPRYHAERRQTLLIDRESRVVDDPGGAARALWPATWPDEPRDA